MEPEPDVENNFPTIVSVADKTAQSELQQEKIELSAYDPECSS